MLLRSSTRKQTLQIGPGYCELSQTNSDYFNNSLFYKANHEDLLYYIENELLLAAGTAT